MFNREQLHLVLHSTALACSLLSGLLGLTVIIAWCANLPAAIRILPEFPPMQFNTALCFLLSSCGLTALVSERPRIALGCGLLTALIGLLTLAQSIFSANLGIDELLMRHYLDYPLDHPGRMAAATATGFIICGLALLCLASAARWRAGFVCSALLATLVFSFGAGRFISYLTITETPFVMQQFTNMALHTAAGFTLLGGGILSRALQGDRHPLLALPRWAPLPAGVFVAMLSVMLAVTLINHEYVLAEQDLKSELTWVQNHIRRLFQPTINAVGRMSARWQARGSELSRAEWETDAQLYVRDIDGIYAMEYIDLPLTRYWRVVATDEAQQALFVPATDASRKGALSDAIERIIVGFKNSIDLIPKERGFQIYSPVFIEQIFQGLIIASVSYQMLLEPLGLELREKGYGLAVSNAGVEVFRNTEIRAAETRQQKHEGALEIYGVPFSVTIWPTDFQTAGTASLLPEATLLIGLVLAALLTLALHQTQTAALRTRQVEAAGRDLDNFFNLSLDLMCVATLDGYFKRVNHSFSRILGYQPDEFLKYPYVYFVHPDDRQPTQLESNGLQTGRPTIDFENRYRSKDGSYRWFSWHALPSLEDRLIYAVARDVTEQKKMQQELLELNRDLEWRVDERSASLIQAEQKFRRVLEAAPETMLIVDEQGKIVIANHETELLFGYSNAELIGQTIELLVPERLHESHLKHRESYNRNPQTRLMHAELELYARHRDGHEIPVEIYLNPITIDGGNLTITVVHDVTEQKRINRERENMLKSLREKNQELEQLIYVASHDLRSPLVNIQGFSNELSVDFKELAGLFAQLELTPQQLAKLNRLARENIPRALNIVQSSTIKMNTLLSGILKISRLGRHALSIKRLEMNELLAQVCEGFYFQVRDAAIDLRIDPLPPCYGDEAQVSQVFANLIGNALKYLHPRRPGKIRVSGTETEGHSVYCVEDNGIGIATQHQQKVFQIFYRLNPGGTSGEGLGLTIVQKCLERLNGRVWIESELDAGSKFFVALPAIRMLAPELALEKSQRL